MQRPKEFEFQPYTFPKSNATQQQQPNQYESVEPFNADERESLKNAFRYILIEKDTFAQAYPKMLIELATSQNLSRCQNKYGEEPPFYLFHCAEQISGERYFSKHLMKCSQKQRNVTCRFMLWFLEVKYLRYIHEHGKGKRRHMKKELYIKFKNQVMIPYIHGILGNNEPEIEIEANE